MGRLQTEKTADPEPNSEESQVIAEVELTFADNSAIGEGDCSCVCINHEMCCGCILQ